MTRLYFLTTRSEIAVAKYRAMLPLMASHPPYAPWGGVGTDFDFGADSVSDLEFAGNEALQREIAYWWVTQGTSPGASQSVRDSPSEVLDTSVAYTHPTLPTILPLRLLARGRVADAATLLVPLYS